MSPWEYRCMAYAFWRSLPPGDAVVLRKLEETYVIASRCEGARSLVRGLVLSLQESGAVAFENGHLYRSSDWPSLPSSPDQEK